MTSHVTPAPEGWVSVLDRYMDVCHIFDFLPKPCISETINKFQDTETSTHSNYVEMFS